MAQAEAAEERIYCEKLSCSLSKVICVRRQEKAEKYRNGDGANYCAECFDCEQGKLIKGGNGMEKKTPMTCRVDGCDKPILARWMCQPHYDQWRARGKKPEELPEGLGERKLPIGGKKKAAAAKPKVNMVLSAGKNAPASITRFVNGLMAEMRREVITEMQQEINAAFKRMGGV